MNTPSKYIEIRSNPAVAGLKLYNIKRHTVRSVTIFDNTISTLLNGDIAVDYGSDKKEWTFVIETFAGLTTNFTAANLTSLESYYALRTTQTLYLLDAWKESSVVTEVHFLQLNELPHEVTGTDKYILRFLEK